MNDFELNVSSETISIFLGGFIGSGLVLVLRKNIIYVSFLKHFHLLPFINEALVYLWIHPRHQQSNFHNLVR